MNPRGSADVFPEAILDMGNVAMQEHSGIVVFDGICGFCSAAVQFILENDREGRLAFAPMQSPLGRALLTRHGMDPSDVQTFLLVREGQAFIRSDAALEIARDLGKWRWLRVFRFVPKPLRDGAYRVLARNRYRWFGRRETCFLPTPEQRARFLDDADVEQEVAY